MLHSRLINLVPKNLIKQSIARSHETPYQGITLPFRTDKPRLLAIKMIIFFSIPYSLPFILWRRQVYKTNGF
ncbi:hypothetical protein QR98_0018780 [Sarcoptes scabiei]|uniref:Uncharacterized protein n=1 Tax=Sarcoptes scabiei TaxID=52283 RepID=A0A131ZXB2_SARSC|nr:hypothetical protein QR98_0018780 [Sarcoptes scabiei]